MGPKSNLFKITFLISLIVHAVFFLPIPELKKPKQKETKQLYLSYLTLKIPAKKKVAQFKHKKIILKNRRVSPKKKLTAESQKNSVIKEQDDKKVNSHTVKRLNNKQDKIVKLRQKKQIVTAADESKKKELSKNKSYISYYKLINEQLRQAVIYPSHFSEGEISLSFVLASDGKLKNVEVLQATSLENEILKETAMQIVKRASPFPPFPKNLQQKQLTFNIVFCFKESS